MLKTIGKIGLAVLVGFLFVNLIFGGKGDKDVDLRQLIKENALVVDTRTPGEFSNGHITGAVNIPYDIIAQSIDQYETDKSKSIIVYCRSGNRSSYAKISLLKMGYTNVVNGGSIGNMQRQSQN